MSAPATPTLSSSAWAVLSVVAEQPTHGFAVAQLLSHDGLLGQVWTVRRPVVYREIRKLLDLELVYEVSNEPSEQGPDRTILAASPTGRRAVGEWLEQPVIHVRDVRTTLLLKLALLDRAGADIRPLAHAQQETLGPQIQGLRTSLERAAGFERILAQWRLTSSLATAQFLNDILGDSGTDPNR